MAKVLVTDCWTRKTLSAVRSLGTEGVTVHATSHTRIAPGLYSRYTSKYYLVPDPKKEPQKYLQHILDILKKEKYDCLMPFEESSIELFLSVREEIEKYTNLPVTSAKTYNTANSKWEVLKLARKIGVPAPLTFRPENDPDLQTALQQLKFPLIIKPVSSSGSRGLKKISDQQEFAKVYPEIVQQYGFPLIQEYIEQHGEGCGVGILAHQGKILTCFSYKRLREFPVSGGPSTLRESTNDPELKEYAEKLIEALKWDGVAMVEFKRDPVNWQPKLMEINPRFWGSLDLSYVSGVNFPYLLLQYAKGQKVEPVDYRTGVRDRWLFPGDIAHFIANPKRFSLKPSFFSFFEKDTFYDDFKRDDMRGNIAVLLCTVAMAFDPEIWKIGVFRK